MKIKSILLLTLILGIQLCSAQAPDWTRLLQVSTFGLQNGNAVDADANYVYMAGDVCGPVTFDGINYSSIGYHDMILTKISNSGLVIWTKQFNTQVNGSISPNAIKVDAGQNIYVSGTFTGTMTIGISTITSGVMYNEFIAKFDANGNGMWASAFLADGSGISKIALDGSNNCYLISSTSKLLKFNNSGIKLWEQSYPDQTLQALAINGSNLYIGGTLQDNTTFGTITLNSSGAYNIGFLLRANLDGVYNRSLVVGGIQSADGSSVSDIIIDNTGNLIIAGGYTRELILDTIAITNASYSYYAYIAKCNSDFVFAWAKSSTITANQNRQIWTYRIFADNANNLYEYGLISSSFNFGSIPVNPNGGQFLVTFDPNGNATNSVALQNTSYDKILITPAGKIVTTGSYNYEGATSYGNLFLTQYNSDMSINWQKKSSNSQSGLAQVNYVKHDSIGNTYIKSCVRGYCNFFGTLMNSDTSKTIISKHDLSGDLVWMNQIADNAFLYDLGPKFTLDEYNNVLTTGDFKTSMKIGNHTFNNQDLNNDGYVAKYTSTGQLAWAVQLNVEGYYEINGITCDKDGNIIVSGYFLNQITVSGYTISAGTDFGVFIIKLDAAGNLLWAKSYTVNVIIYIAMVSTDGNNNIYLAAEMYDNTHILTFDTVSTPQTNEDGGTVLVKFEPNGTPLWAHTYGGVVGGSYPDNWPVDIKTDANGNSYLVGWCQKNAVFGATTLTNPISNRNWVTTYLTKIDSSGTVIWANGIYGKIFRRNYGDLLDIDKSGNLYIGGHFGDSISISGEIYQPVGLYDFYLTKYSNNGVFQWIKTIPSDEPIINALGVFDNDILTIVGSSGKNSSLGSYSITKKGGSSCIIATLGNLPATIDEINNNNNVHLYPNPSTGNITIIIPTNAGSQAEEATIDIFNIQGQIVKYLTVSDDKTSIDISALPSGLYIMEVKMKNSVVRRKFVKE